MNCLFARVIVAAMLCVTVSLAHAAQRGKGEARPGGGRSNEGQAEREREERNKESERNKRGVSGNKAPGGEWSQRSHSGRSVSQQGQHEHTTGLGPRNNAKGLPSGTQGAPGAAAQNRKSSQSTATQGAEAGVAAANRSGSAATVTQGTTPGAPAANQSFPKYSGKQGAVAGAALANRNDGYGGVRNGFNGVGMYGAGWYGAHPSAWAATGWSAGAVRMPTSWNTFAGMYGYGNTAPVNYDYGGSVNCQNGNVFVNGQNVGTAEEFSQQAYDLADAGSQANTSDTDKWLPLGVFAMVRDEKQAPNLITQLAINEQGILRGNYTDVATNKTSPIEGSVDKKAQRAAWTVGNNKMTVVEAGLNNLTENEAPALVHKDGKTDHWILVRLDQPNREERDKTVEEK